MKKWICLAVTLLVMGVIFFLSAQTGPVSSSLSNQIAQSVQSSSVAKAVTPRWFSASNGNANVRKWAHVYLYCALGLSMACTVAAFEARNAKKFLRAIPGQAVLAAALCFVYAASDEFHQLFVAGRAAMLSDIGLDALGFLPCIFFVFLLIWGIRTGKKAHPKTQQD
jgi:VanZ family protein